MQQIKRLNEFLVMAAIILVTLYVSSCSSNKFFGFDIEESGEFEEIANSNEFTDYLLAQVYFSELLENINKDQMEFVEIRDGLKIYRCDLTDEMDYIRLVRQQFISKYPQYVSENQAYKNELINVAVQKSTKLRAAGFNSFPRTKSSNSESQASLSLTKTSMGAPWTVSIASSYDDAIDACITYGLNYHKESGGYAYSDHSGLFITASNATNSTMDFPVWDWRPFTPTFAFHYHPSGSTSMSNDDWSALAAMMAYGCDNMLIVTNDKTYKYRLFY